MISLPTRPGRANIDVSSNGFIVGANMGTRGAP